MKITGENQSSDLEKGVLTGQVPVPEKDTEPCPIFVPDKSVPCPNCEQYHPADEEVDPT